MRESVTEVTARDGTRLRVTLFGAESAGAGSAVRDILLLHGWPNAGRVWRPLAEAMLLGQANYRLVAPDFRGFGDSDKPEAGYACARFTDDAEDVAAALGLTRYALVGHSMGGKIAQLLASRRPEALAALALVAPVPLVAAPVPEEKKASQRTVYGDEARTRDLLAGMAARDLDPAVMAPLVQDGLRAARAAWDGWIDPMREEDFTGEAGKIGVPTLVIGGGKDPLRSEELLRRDIVDRIARARYADLPQAGHLIHLEEPAALAALLVNFLDEA